MPSLGSAAALTVVKIGPYDVVSELGRGGMGLVVRARSPSGEDVALKLLTRRDPETLARFDRERRLLGQFTAREGFVPLLDSGVAPQGPFLVMPYLPGGTLRTWLEQEQGALDVAQVVELGRALAGAVGRAHERGVVHRDLKPENVLFAADGTPLIADLGLAKHFDTGAAGASQSASLSTGGALRGTAGYMAPEQAADAASAGPAADVFALGAILYECLTGRAPFAGESIVDVLTKVESGSFEGLRRVRAEVPRWLAAVVEKALAHAPERRFADGLALRRALDGPAAGRGGLLLAGAALIAAASVVAFALRPRATAAPPSLPPAPTTPVASAADTKDVPVRVTARSDAATLFSKGLDRADAGDLDGAIVEWTKAIALDPWLRDAWGNRALARSKKGDHEGALADFAKAIECDPTFPGTWCNRGTARFNADDHAGALGDLTRAIELEPRYATAWAFRGATRTHLGDLDGALADLTRALELDATLVVAWTHRGLAKQAKGDRQGAIADLTRALELDPKAVLARETRASLRLERGDYDGAIADLTSALELRPGHAPSWFNRGVARAKVRDARGALADYAKAVELDPKLAVGWWKLGSARMDRGDLDGAIADLTKAIELDPKLSLAWGDRAAAKAQKKDHAGAIADNTRAIELDPKHALEWANRGLAKQSSGDIEGAIADYEHFLEIAPQEPRAPTVRQKLKALKASRGR